MEIEDDYKIKIVQKAGISIIKQKPKFSSDSKYLFCCADNFIKVLSTSSGECLHVLKGHETEVVSLAIEPLNSLQLISCSRDGIIIVWAYLDGTALRTYAVNCNVHAFYVIKTDSSPRWFVVAEDKFLDNNLYEVTTQDNNKVTCNKVFSSVTPGENFTAFGKNAKFFGTVKSATLFVCRLEKRFVFRYESDKIITCVACHPEDECIATGDNKGRIYLWFNILNNNCITSVLHWHNLSVIDFAFSAHGSKLWSGGGECVLVDWTLSRSYDKNFLPRLGAPIRHITCCPNNSFIAVCIDDNSILLVDSDKGICQIYQSFSQDCTAKLKECIPTGFVYDPRLRAIVCNGKVGHLQFFSVQEDKLLFCLDITNKNFYHKRRNYIPKNVEVKKVAISQDGLHLLTFEMRDDKITMVDLVLKFWYFNEVTQRFVLNTYVDKAHTKEINSLLFFNSSKSTLMAVSIGKDGYFKLWKQAVKKNTGESYWTCDLVGSYRELPASSGAISEDGSMLAVTFGTLVTLWESHSFVFHKALNFPNDLDLIDVVFGTKTRSHFLVAMSYRRLTVWNLLSFTVQIHIDQRVHLITKDPYSEYVAVFTKNRSLIVFRPGDVGPTYIHECISIEPVTAAVFIPLSDSISRSENHPLSWQNHSQLYFFDSSQKILAIEEEGEENKTELIQVTQDLPKTPFEALLALEKKTEVEDAPLTPHEQEIHQKELLNEIFFRTSQTLPPVSDLFNAFVMAVDTKTHFSENGALPVKQIQTGTTNQPTDETPMEVDNSSVEDSQQLESQLKYFEKCHWLTSVLTF